MRALSTSAQTQLLHKHFKPLEESHSCLGPERSQVCVLAGSEVSSPDISSQFLLTCVCVCVSTVCFLLLLKYHFALLSWSLSCGLITGRDEVSVYMHTQSLHNLFKAQQQKWAHVNWQTGTGLSPQALDPDLYNGLVLKAVSFLLFAACSVTSSNWCKCDRRIVHVKK